MIIMDVKLACAVLADLSAVERQQQYGPELMKHLVRLQTSISVFFHSQVKVGLRLQPLSPQSY